MTLSKPTTLADWLAYIEHQHPRSIDMGLDRVRAVATAMALKRPARRVITVGGTNGKGSTVAFIESIARAAGWRGMVGGQYLVYAIRAARDGDLARATAEERGQLREQLSMVAGGDAQRAYVKAARAKYEITVAEDRL